MVYREAHRAQMHLTIILSQACTHTHNIKTHVEEDTKERVRPLLMSNLWIMEMTDLIAYIHTVLQNRFTIFSHQIS